MEDAGRLVRGAEAVRLWGVAVDHGVRCIAIHDCIDTVDESWESDLMAACSDHMGHNQHTSQRLKTKLMKRFKRNGAAVALPVAGYNKPENAETYFDWVKVDSATPIIAEGLRLLRESKNCTLVADYFNRVGYATGPYCELQEWTGPAVRRYFRNPILSGRPGRGFTKTVKHNESGKRIAVKCDREDVNFIDCPHLAHISAADQDEVNLLLDKRNAGNARHDVAGQDPLYRRGRKQTSFPGQHAKCAYCGQECVWGGNGQTHNLICKGARKRLCWNSFSFNGPRAAQRLVEIITAELHTLAGYDEQFRELVQVALQRNVAGGPQRWEQLHQSEAQLAKQDQSLKAMILESGPTAPTKQLSFELEKRRLQLARERMALEELKRKQLDLPADVAALQQLHDEAFGELAIDSPEFGLVLRRLAPEFHVYLVRSCEGGSPLPRALVRLDLAGLIPDAARAPELVEFLSRTVIIDLFNDPPQRVRIREEVVALTATGMPQHEIADALPSGKTTVTAVQRALVLDRKMRELGLNTPYVFLAEPPRDIAQLKRILHPKYRFEPLAGYPLPAPE